MMKGRAIKNFLLNQSSTKKVVQPTSLEHLRDACVIRFEFYLKLLQLLVKSPQVLFYQLVNLIGEIDLLVGILERLIIVLKNTSSSLV